ncbi:transaldolase [uncultured Oceanicoccus sp.]|uniref:transaldolase n=1 Tax=uncultured Oceanicoccus sp. TaxID=1706381 RepID=UPI0030DA7B2B
MSNKLDQLKSITDVVADTGDIEAIERFKPMDATTNPSLLLKAAQLPRYAKLVTASKAWAQQQGGSEKEQLANCSDKLAVAIGCEILNIIPGKISTEVDARLSFDTAATIEKARKLIGLYGAAGIEPNRVLIKIAATWEGIKAAEVLEQEGINCNLTLLFGFAQAAACADAGVFLISPFVGRILDWYKANTGQKDYRATEDPGVLSVSRIYNFYKQQGYQTVVMGASFRNLGEIEQLAGCDRLTISPALLEQLANDNGVLERQLDADNTGTAIAKPDNTEQAFRWAMNEDAMATEKLAEGIRNFTIDQIKLEQLLKDRS